MKPVRKRGMHWRWWVAGGFLVGVAAGILVFRVPVKPPPLVDTTGFDPAIAAAVEEARQRVLSRPRAGDSWGRLGMVLLAHEIRGEARECFLKAAALEPNQPRWAYFLGLAQLVDNPMAAVTNLDRAVRLFAAQGEGETAPRIRLADTLLNLGQVEQAESHYRQAWELQPGSAPAALGLGKVANAREQTKEAAELLERATADPATRKAAHRLLLGVYQRLGETNRVEDLAKTMSGLPNDQDLPDKFHAELEQLKTGANEWIDRADVWIKAGRVAEAAQLLEKTLQKYPDSDRAMFFLGRAKYRLGDMKAAESILTRAIEMSPGKLEAQMQLGIIYLARGSHTEAQRCFRAALEAKPNLAEGWYNLGLSLGNEDRAESMAAFREAIRLKPGLTEAYLGLAVVLRAEGKRQAAAEVLREALALKPEEALRQKVVDQLKALETL